MTETTWPLCPSTAGHRELTLVGNCRQSLGDIAGDGLPDEPGGGASCGAQHDVRGSELLAVPLGTRVGSGWSRLRPGFVGSATGSWLSGLATSGLLRSVIKL